MKHCLGLALLVCLSFGSIFAQTEAPPVDTLLSKSEAPIFVDTVAQSVVVDTTTVLKNPRKSIFAYKNGTPNPKKSILFSLVLPGAGQAYNGDWWKTPIAFGAVAGVGYLFQQSQSEYARYRDAFRLEKAGMPHEFSNLGLTDDFLARQRDQFDNQRQLMILGVLGVYFLQAAEAFSSAHLKGFEVNEDLSFRIVPQFESTQLATTTGVGVVVLFR